MGTSPKPSLDSKELESLVFGKYNPAFVWTGDENSIFNRDKKFRQKIMFIYHVLFSIFKDTNVRDVFVLFRYLL